MGDRGYVSIETWKEQERVNATLRAERDALKARVAELERSNTILGDAALATDKRAEAAEARVKDLMETLGVREAQRIEVLDALRAEQEAHAEDLLVSEKRLQMEIQLRLDLEAAQEAHRATSRKMEDIHRCFVEEESGRVAAEARVKSLESDIPDRYAAMRGERDDARAALKAEQEAHRATKEIVALQLEQIHERADDRDAAQKEASALRAALEACHEEQSERIRRCFPSSPGVALLTLNEKVLLALTPAAALGRCDHCGNVNCICAARSAPLTEPTDGLLANTLTLAQVVEQYPEQVRQVREPKRNHGSSGGRCPACEEET